ncbi:MULTISPECIES: hypothetical protein [unclassified Exiguobacterium]|uniref:hypothetical protein n=1 Tax=unclassified Exiguobacterium TaxID=2644629 RepID=UPI001BE91C8D|nr:MULTISPECIES: hypothetical protein [unclassified Exiguobacterium]
MRLVNLVRERKSDNSHVVDTFLVKDSITEPEVALRDAVKDFLMSDEGKKCVIYACGDFNWGDAISNITDEFLQPHGLVSFNVSETIVVNQDEVLFSDIQEEVLCAE